MLGPAVAGCTATRLPDGVDVGLLNAVLDDAALTGVQAQGGRLRVAEREAVRRVAVDGPEHLPEPRLAPQISKPDF